MKENMTFFCVAFEEGGQSEEGKAKEVAGNHYLWSLQAEIVRERVGGWLDCFPMVRLQVVIQTLLRKCPDTTAKEDKSVCLHLYGGNSEQIIPNQ